jgi:RHH-type proline utilization regulon transcriptional repressor/proline dehydrogenase/delta 1-pyrroline-5-carboxylate dehydrogenase
VRPGSEFHRTEYFGPVLGLMHAPDLETAIAWQNATDFGLTAGIHTLDAREVDTWLEQVEAGNLYVNRGTTGAIVQRQPFGGWKRSSVGGSTKAGGPNYLARLGRWELRPRTAAVKLDGRVARTLAAASGSLSPADVAWLTAAAESDQVAWDKEFGLAKDVAGLASERNVLRYRPVPVTIRSDGPLRDLVRVVLAAQRVGAPVVISSGTGPIDLPGLDVVVESHDAWLDRLERDRPERVRLVGTSRTAAADAVGGDADVAFFDDPVTASGRIEGLPFVREQAVSITRHRFGNRVRTFDALLPRGPRD